MLKKQRMIVINDMECGCARATSSTGGLNLSSFHCTSSHEILKLSFDSPVFGKVRSKYLGILYDRGL